MVFSDPLFLFLFLPVSNRYDGSAANPIHAGATRTG